MEITESEARSPDHIETIVIQSDWYGLGDIYYCKVSRDNVCVEAVGNTKRQALRRARRAWREEHNAEVQRTSGYPRRVECDD